MLAIWSLIDLPKNFDAHAFCAITFRQKHTHCCTKHVFNFGSMFKWKSISSDTVHREREWEPNSNRKLFATNVYKWPECFPKNQNYCNFKHTPLVYRVHLPKTKPRIQLKFFRVSFQGSHTFWLLFAVWKSNQWPNRPNKLTQLDAIGLSVLFVWLV